MIPIFPELRISGWEHNLFALTSLSWEVDGMDLLRWPNIHAKSWLVAFDKSLLFTNFVYLKTYLFYSVVAYRHIIILECGSLITWLPSDSHVLGECL